MVVLARGEQAAEREVNAARLLALELVVAQVGGVHDLGERGEPPVAEPGAPQQRLERAVLARVAELGADDVERDRLRRQRVGWREQELGIRVDEALDEPRRGDTVDVRARARDPAPPAQRLERRGGRAGRGRAGRAQAKLDGLAQALDLAPARRVEEVDRAQALELAREPCGRLARRPGRRSSARRRAR